MFSFGNHIWSQYHYYLQKYMQCEFINLLIYFVYKGTSSSRPFSEVYPKQGKKKKKGALNKTVEDVITNMSYTVKKFMEILVGHNLLQSFGGMKWYIVL